MRDSAIASEYAWKFLDNARRNEMPSIGNLQTLGGNPGEDGI